LLGWNVFGILTRGGTTFVAQSGNGIDTGTIYQLLTQMSVRMDTMSARLDQVLSVVNDHTRILDDHSRKLADLSEGMAELHKTVDHYHEAVIGQGLHYSDLEGRVLRVERHLKLGSES
jgi:hypothetical protein